MNDDPQTTIPKKWLDNIVAESRQYLADRDRLAAQVATLTDALRKISDLPLGEHLVLDPSRSWDTSYAPTDIDVARAIARAALEAASQETTA